MNRLIDTIRDYREGRKQTIVIDRKQKIERALSIGFTMCVCTMQIWALLAFECPFQIWEKAKIEDGRDTDPVS